MTTATDLFSPFDDTTLDSYRTVAADDAFPLRLLPAINTLAWSPEEGVERLRAAMQGNNEHLVFRLGMVMPDGSIQGYTARLRWSGYYNGAPNGLWNLEPEQLSRLVDHYQRAGVQMSCGVSSKPESCVSPLAGRSCVPACGRSPPVRTLS